MIDNNKFNPPNARVKNKVERRKIIAEEIAKQSCEDLLRSLQDQEVPSAPILSREEVIENEQVLENNMIQYFDSKIFGKIRSPRPAPIYTKTPVTGKQLAPLLGQNSEEILKELDYSEKEINSFIKEKIITKLK